MHHTSLYTALSFDCAVILMKTCVCVQPIAVLLCPGWEKVQAVYDLLEEMKVAPTLHPIIVVLGVGKDEAKAVRIPKNCERSTIFGDLASSAFLFSFSFLS